MKNEKRFKEIVAQYCEVKPEDMNVNLRLREDLGFSSLDFMSLLGELEDEFDVEVELESASSIHTIGEALSYIEEYAQAS